MPTLDLDKLQALCDAATDGPWEHLMPHVVCAIHGHELPEVASCGGPRWPENAEFIAAARMALPQLIARVRELEARQQELLELIVRISRDCIMTDELRGQIAAVIAECGTLRSKLRDV